MGSIGGALGSTRSSASHLTLGSVKSVYGHTEGAAGLSGVLLAAAALDRSCAAPVVCLTGVNPYVATAMSEDWAERFSMQAVLPRQAAAAAHVPGVIAAGLEFYPACLFIIYLAFVIFR